MQINLWLPKNSTCSFASQKFASGAHINVDISLCMRSLCIDLSISYRELSTKFLLAYYMLKIDFISQFLLVLQFEKSFKCSKVIKNSHVLALAIFSFLIDRIV